MHEGGSVDLNSLDISIDICDEANLSTSSEVPRSRQERTQSSEFARLQLYAVHHSFSGQKHPARFCDLLLSPANSKVDYRRSL